MPGTREASAASPADVLSALAGAASAPAAEARAAAAAAREMRLLAGAASGLQPDLGEADRPTRIQGVRNRLFLKYLGVDFEHYNTEDMRYRGGAVGELQGL